MSRFFHSAFYKNHWVILGLSIILFVFGLAFRLYRLDQRVWFKGDSTRDLLYAWNIVHDHKPLSVGPVTSGSTMPNAPFYLDFLALLMWTSGSNPITVIYLFTIITTTVVPLLFIWGVIEGASLSGFIAAFLFALFRGAFEFTNVWNPFLATVPCMLGVILFRLAVKNHSQTYRFIGLYLLCLAGVIHYSFIGILVSIILYEFFRSRNARQALIDIGFSVVVLFLLLFPTLILLKQNNALSISIRYSNGTCRFCLQKIPLLLQSLFSQLFWMILPLPYARQLLYILAGCLIFTGFIVRRKLFAWGFYISILFLLFAWAFAGQIAYWYLLPFVLFATYLFGDILARGLRDRFVYVRILSLASLLIFISISLRCYSEGYSSTNNIQNVIDTEAAVKEILLPFGISGGQYVEYADLTTDGISDTTAFWLVRQWNYHEVITYNDPLHSYDPATINPTPLYRVYMCRDCKQQTNASLNERIQDGYRYERKVSLGNNLWMYVYKRKK